MCLCVGAGHDGASGVGMGMGIGRERVQNLVRYRYVGIVVGKAPPSMFFPVLFLGGLFLMNSHVRK